jgi:hypothetical protein
MSNSGELISLVKKTLPGFRRGNLKVSLLGKGNIMTRPMSVRSQRKELANGCRKCERQLICALDRGKIFSAANKLEKLRQKN